MANIHVDNVKRLRYYAEPNGSLGTDHTGTLGDFSDLAAIEGTVKATLTYEMADPGSIVQDRDEKNKEILLRKRWSMTFSHSIGAPDDRSAAASAIEQPLIGKLLSLWMGGEELGQGDVTTAVGLTTSAFGVANPARFKPGGCVVVRNAAGEHQMREIESVVGSLVTIKMAVTTAPATGATLYGCASYYLNNKSSDSVKTAQFILEGLSDTGEVEDCWVLMGGQCTSPPTILTENGQIVGMTFTLTGADWENGDDASMTPAVLANATYGEHNEIKVVDGDFYTPEVGDNSLDTPIPASSIAFEPQFKYLEVPSPGGTNNIQAYIPGREEKGSQIKGNFQLPYENQDWHDHRNGRTNLAMFFQTGSGSGGGALFSAPTVQATDVQNEPVGGIKSQIVNWVGRLDTDTSSTTTAIGLSPYRIHIY